MVCEWWDFNNNEDDMWGIGDLGGTSKRVEGFIFVWKNLSQSWVWMVEILKLLLLW
jgi:hypothetical protein